MNLPFRKHTPDEGFEKRTISTKILSPAHRHLTKKKNRKKYQRKAKFFTKINAAFSRRHGQTRKKNSAAEKLRGRKEKCTKKFSSFCVCLSVFWGSSICCLFFTVFILSNVLSNAWVAFVLFSTSASARWRARRRFDSGFFSPIHVSSFSSNSSHGFFSANVSLTIFLLKKKPGIYSLPIFLFHFKYINIYRGQNE